MGLICGEKDVVVDLTTSIWAKVIAIKHKPIQNPRRRVLRVADWGWVGRGGLWRVGWWVMSGGIKGDWWCQFRFDFDWFWSKISQLGILTDIVIKYDSRGANILSSRKGESILWGEMGKGMEKCVCVGLIVFWVDRCGGTAAETSFVPRPEFNIIPRQACPNSLYKHCCIHNNVRGRCYGSSDSDTGVNGKGYWNSGKISILDGGANCRWTTVLIKLYSMIVIGDGKRYLSKVNVRHG